MRVGLGFDIHRLVPERPLFLGGLCLPYPKGLLGHSDGDALLHAMIDALLGASGHGDIGEWFSDQDPANRGRDSAEMAKLVLRQIQHEGFCIDYFDTIIFAEAPKIAPIKQKIRERLAEIFELDISQINLKAKTMEKLGPIGQEEAIAAQAIVLLVSKIHQKNKP